MITKLKCFTNKIKKFNKGGFNGLSIAILSAIIALYINFFTISLNKTDFLSTISSFLWGGFVFIIYFLIIYTGNISKYRSIFFICFAFVFFPAFINNLITVRGSFQITQHTILKKETPYCHIVTTMTIIPYIFTKTLNFPAQLKNHYASVYSMLIIWIISSIFIGKGWCSWVCFYGGFDEFFSKISKKRYLKIDYNNELIKYFNFVILFFVIFATLVVIGPVYCEWLCPFKLVTEFSAIDDIKSYVQTIVFITLFFTLVVLLPFLAKKRFQCMSFCPFGAMQSFVDKISLYKIIINPEICIKCKRCIKICPINALSDYIIDNNIPHPLITCNKCGTCISNCPVNAIQFSFRGINYNFTQNSKININIKNKDIKKLKTNFQNHIKLVYNKYKFLETISLYLSTTFKQILSCKALFITSAMIFGLIISSGFAIATIKLFLKLIF